MNIIEKIEIKHFRSFDGGKDQEKIKIDKQKKDGPNHTLNPLA